LTLPRKEKERNHQKLSSPWITNPARKKVNTTPPRTPSPPLNRHPSSPPIIQTFIIQPPSLGTPQQPLLLPPFLPPISPLITTPLLFLPSSAIPSHHTPYPSNHLDVATLSPTLSPTHPPRLVGILHTRALYERNRPQRAPQNIHHLCRPLYVP